MSPIPISNFSFAIYLDIRAHVAKLIWQECRFDMVFNETILSTVLHFSIEAFW